MQNRSPLVVLGLFLVVALAPSAIAQPANDDCTNAIAITDASCGGFQDSLDTTAATTEGGEAGAGCTAAPGHTVWYQFTSPVTRQVSIDTVGSDFDTVLQVFTGSCGVTTEIACDDDGGGGLTSSLSFTAEAGVTYLIRAGSFDGNAGGNLTLSLDCPNDDCANATEITDATCSDFEDSRDTTNATTEAGEAGATCTATPSHTVWYQFTSSITRPVRIDTEDSDFDTVLQVFTGSCGATTEVACDDDSGPGLTSFLTFTAQAGVPYLIRAASFDGFAGGNLEFSLDCRLCAESGRGGGGTLLLDPLTGDYEFCCNSGANQTGTAVLTQQGACRLRFDDTTGGNRVLGTFDLCRNSADASLQQPVPVTQCVIPDLNTRNNVCECGLDDE